VSADLFDLTSTTDDGLVDGFRRTGRPAVYSRDGISLVLHCLYRGREAAAKALAAAGHRLGVHEAAALGDTSRLAVQIAPTPASGRGPSSGTSRSMRRRQDGRATWR
jgi:hypothetical protein